ncbi:MAG: PDZ domain-containing protein [Actinomycetota bacterium]
MDPDRTPPILAEPGDGKPSRSVFKRVVLLMVLAGLAVAAFRVPIGIFYAYLPGPVRSVEPLIDISGAQTYSSEGGLYLTTVSVDTEVTFVELIDTILDPNSTVIMKEDLLPSGISLKQLEQQQREQMTSSKRRALEVALAALDLGRPSGDGARVQGTEPDYPAAGKLREGDVIVEVDGREVATTCDVGRAVDQHSPGDQIVFTVERNGRRTEAIIESTQSPEDPDAPFVGVYMEDVNYEFDPGIDVQIKTGEIAGPSAGLMFSLAIYDLLTPEDLTMGRKIAGTGEIACDGGVRPIGGIEQKVAGAAQQGAEIFLAPAANFRAAVEAANGEIEIVKVSNFDDALAYLENLAAR